MSSRQASVDAAVATITQEARSLDVVVHNAGHMMLGPAGSFTPEKTAEISDARHGLADNVRGDFSDPSASPTCRRRGQAADTEPRR